MLTDTKIRKTKAGDKPIKLADTNGLYLNISTTGGKVWRYRYKIGGKEKLLTIGDYPHISLAEARKVRDSARQDVKAGRDPSQLKLLSRIQTEGDQKNLFRKQALEWFEINKTQWVTKHATDVWRSFEKEALPDLGDLPVKEISALQVLDMLRKVEQRGAADTARRIRQRVSHVFQFCIAKGICEIDPASQVEKAMAPISRGRQPAITDLDTVREIIKRCDETPAHPVTKLAHRLLALTALRPGTLITTPWEEFEDLEDQENIWIIPAARMKLKKQYKDDERRDHLVPLSSQALETIRGLHKLTGRGPLAFPNTRHAHKSMSENAIGYLLNRAGYHHKHVPHGWRSAFSTVMNERKPEDRAIIDFTLAHVPKDRIEAAYNRALYLKQRKRILQEWADLLMADQMPIDEVIKLPRRINRKLIEDE